MSEDTDDFEIDLGELPTPSDGVEINLGPLGEENEPREEIALADEPEEDGPERPETDDVTVAAAAKLREELGSKFGEQYIIHTYSGMENRIKQNLDSRATSLNMEDCIFETAIPTEEVIGVRDSTRETVTHYVPPSYVLVQVELTDDSWVTVHHAPFVTDFVGRGQTPVPLSLDEVVDMLTPSVVAKMASKASTVVARARKRVEVVDFVVDNSMMMIDGPFTEVHVTITEISTNQQRFRVLVEILGRETPVDLEFKRVERVGQVPVRPGPYSGTLRRDPGALGATVPSPKP